MYIRRLKVRPNVSRTTTKPQNNPVIPVVNSYSSSPGPPDTGQPHTLEAVSTEDESLTTSAHSHEKSDSNIILEKPHVEDANVCSNKDSVSPGKIDLSSSENPVISREDPITVHEVPATSTDGPLICAKEQLTVSKDTIIPNKEPVTSKADTSTDSEDTVASSRDCIPLRRHSIIQGNESVISRKGSLSGENEVLLPTSVTDTSDSVFSDKVVPSQHLVSTKTHKKIKNDKEVARYRRWQNKSKDPPERSKMTMMDLIYYNPSENPMKTPPKVSHKESKSDEAGDSVDSAATNSPCKDADVPDADFNALAPRVKIGEDGQIILDEESLVIQHTVPESYSVVTEDSETTYFSFRERLQPRRWSTKETALFYKALTVVGTDFSLMSQLIQKRSRYELKLKFKNEERKNREFIDEILRYSSATDLKEFQEELDDYYNTEHLIEAEPTKERKAGSSSRKSCKIGRPRKKGKDSDLENLEPARKKSHRSRCSNTLVTDEGSLLSMDLADSEDHSNKQTVDEPDGQYAVQDTSPHNETLECENQIPVKRRRGRPRKAVNATDSDSTAANNMHKGDEVIKRSKGRKSKTSNNNSANCEEVLHGKESLVSNMDMVAINTSVSSDNFMLDNPQQIVLVSETGEEFPVEVVYEHTSDESGTQTVSAADGSEDRSNLYTDNFRSVLNTEVDGEMNDLQSTQTVPEASAIDKSKSTKWKSNSSVAKKLQKISNSSTTEKANDKSQTQPKSQPVAEKDELENIKDAVNSILTESSCLKDSVTLPSDITSPEIAAYVTLETEREGRKHTRVSVQEEQVTASKRNKARYSDFTVTESELEELSKPSPSVSNHEQGTSKIACYENVDNYELSGGTAISGSCLTDAYPPNYGGKSSITSGNVILHGNTCPEDLQKIIVLSEEGEVLPVVYEESQCNSGSKAFNVSESDDGEENSDSISNMHDKHSVQHNDPIEQNAEAAVDVTKKDDFSKVKNLSEKEEGKCKNITNSLDNPVSEEKVNVPRDELDEIKDAVRSILSAGSSHSDCGVILPHQTNTKISDTVLLERKELDGMQNSQVEEISVSSKENNTRHRTVKKSSVGSSELIQFLSYEMNRKSSPQLTDISSPEIHVPKEGDSLFDDANSNDCTQSEISLNACSRDLQVFIPSVDKRFSHEKSVGLKTYDAGGQMSGIVDISDERKETDSNMHGVTCESSSKTTSGIEDLFKQCVQPNVKILEKTSDFQEKQELNDSMEHNYLNAVDDSAVNASVQTVEATLSVKKKANICSKWKRRVQVTPRLTSRSTKQENEFKNNKNSTNSVLQDEVSGSRTFEAFSTAQAKKNVESSVMIDEKTVNTNLMHVPVSDVSYDNSQADSMNSNISNVGVSRSPPQFNSSISTELQKTVRSHAANVCQNFDEAKMSVSIQKSHVKPSSACPVDENFSHTVNAESEVNNALNNLNSSAMQDAVHMSPTFKSLSSDMNNPEKLVCITPVDKHIQKNLELKMAFDGLQGNKSANEARKSLSNVNDSLIPQKVETPSLIKPDICNKWKRRTQIKPRLTKRSTEAEPLNKTSVISDLNSRLSCSVVGGPPPTDNAGTKNSASFDEKKVTEDFVHNSIHEALGVTSKEDPTNLRGFNPLVSNSLGKSLKFNPSASSEFQKSLPSLVSNIPQGYSELNCIFDENSNNVKSECEKESHFLESTELLQSSGIPPSISEQTEKCLNNLSKVNNCVNVANCKPSVEQVMKSNFEVNMKVNTLKMDQRLKQKESNSTMSSLRNFEVSRGFGAIAVLKTQNEVTVDKKNQAHSEVGTECDGLQLNQKVTEKRNHRTKINDKFVGVNSKMSIADITASLIAAEAGRCHFEPVVPVSRDILGISELPSNILAEEWEEEVKEVETAESLHPEKFLNLGFDYSQNQNASVISSSSKSKEKKNAPEFRLKNSEEVVSGFTTVVEESTKPCLKVAVEEIDLQNNEKEEEKGRCKSSGSDEKAKICMKWEKQANLKPNLRERIGNYKERESFLISNLRRESSSAVNSNINFRTSSEINPGRILESETLSKRCKFNVLNVSKPASSKKKVCYNDFSILAADTLETSQPAPPPQVANVLELTSDAHAELKKVQQVESTESLCSQGFINSGFSDLQNKTPLVVATSGKSKEENNSPGFYSLNSEVSSGVIPMVEKSTKPQPKLAVRENDLHNNGKEADNERDKPKTDVEKSVSADENSNSFVKWKKLTEVKPALEKTTGNDSEVELNWKEIDLQSSQELGDGGRCNSKSDANGRAKICMKWKKRANLKASLAERTGSYGEVENECEDFFHSNLRRESSSVLDSSMSSTSTEIDSERMLESERLSKKCEFNIPNVSEPASSKKKVCYNDFIFLSAGTLETSQPAPLQVANVLELPSNAHAELKNLQQVESTESLGFQGFSNSQSKTPLVAATSDESKEESNSSDFYSRNSEVASSVVPMVEESTKPQLMLAVEETDLQNNAKGANHNRCRSKSGVTSTNTDENSDSCVKCKKLTEVKLALGKRTGNDSEVELSCKESYLQSCRELKDRFKSKCDANEKTELCMRWKKQAKIKPTLRKRTAKFKKVDEEDFSASNLERKSPADAHSGIVSATNIEIGLDVMMGAKTLNKKWKCDKLEMLEFGVPKKIVQSASPQYAGLQESQILLNASACEKDVMCRCESPKESSVLMSSLQNFVDTLDQKGCSPDQSSFTTVSTLTNTAFKIPLSPLSSGISEHTSASPEPSMVHTHNCSAENVAVQSVPSADNTVLTTMLDKKFEMPYSDTNYISNTIKDKPWGWQISKSPHVKESRVKRKVSPAEERKFYRAMNKIKPETLKILMPNMTEAPHLPRTPSHECCFNGGTCIVPTNREEDRWCICPPNFTGPFCDIDVDECETQDVCQIHEVCRNNYGGYTCECAENYLRDGSDCVEHTSCEEDPCLNFADCVDQEQGKVLCNCRIGYVGRRCADKITECEDNSCADDETCISTPKGFVCYKGTPP